MARTNVSIPDDLLDQARFAGLNVSALARDAIADELDRQARLAAAYAWLDELDAALGAPTRTEAAEAQAWAQGVVAAARRTGDAVDLVTSDPASARPGTQARERTTAKAGRVLVQKAAPGRGAVRSKKTGTQGKAKHAT